MSSVLTIRKIADFDGITAFFFNSMILNTLSSEFHINSIDFFSSTYIVEDQINLQFVNLKAFT